MRRLRELNRFRDPRLEASVVRLTGAVAGDRDLGGVFRVPSPIDGWDLRVHAGVGLGWDHLSVSRQLRTPSWAEMEHVKRLFFRDDEVAFQLHVPPAAHINVHPHCLHIWRPHDQAIPMPPEWMV